MQKKVAVYIRVSTTGQNEAGQREAITAWLKNHGHDILMVTWHVERYTGTTTTRPALDQLQAAIFRGEHEMVVTWRLDRLSRKQRDGINLLANWCDAGVRVVSISQQLDLSGATGRLIAGVLFAVAEMELETMRERQRVGIEAAKQRGVYQGRVPGTTKAKPTRAAELRDRGLTQEEIATALGVSRTTVNRYLRKVG
ncbi:recombinase family protein [Algisphaera agarilytica]|uniref:DNA invertase Pin-like site-specific DNA recombinase n=1 Tax=Algisphaera agarilytica TaxID=1385975 RepID=A0A7X0H946_9BACT|nr:recombinase family protein [Algisphaera agarilytica]MBB6431543.1 DNA invertase Pin-like site-specific DNA recombinase [Algisphaera agarilytica]